MRLLWIATKTPWPPVDGGRLLLLESLRALRGAGAEITLIAPVEAERHDESTAGLAGVCRARLTSSRPRSRVTSAVRSVLSGVPWSLVRHASPALAAPVEMESAAQRFDLAVAEQLQARASASRARLPVLLRAENVESDLWRQVAEKRRGWRRRLLLREARRLMRAEGAAVERSAMTVALSAADASLLRNLAPRGRVEAVAPPFPARLPAREEALDGSPAIVLFGSAGWEPNRLAEERFLRFVWPSVRAEFPAATLHRFGARESPGSRIVHHSRPAESIDAFPANAVLVLPLEVASGVRIRILEAWARGVPVVASAAAASGLRCEDGVELLLASSASEMIDAFRRLANEPGLGAALVAAGRARLLADHDPAIFARRFLAFAEEARVADAGHSADAADAAGTAADRRRPGSR